MTTAEYISRNRWPIGIVSVFIALACSHAYLLTVATAGRPAPVESVPYQRSLVYQDTIQRLTMAQSIDAKARFTWQEPQEGTRRFLLSIESETPKQVSVERVSFFRADTDELDQEMQLSPGANGTLRGELISARSGLWNYKVDLMINQTPALLRGKFVLP